MDNQIAQLIGTQGAFAALFVWLLKITIQQNKQRETEYQKTIKRNQEIIQNLAAKFDVIEDIKQDVEDIKEVINIKK